MKQDNIYRLRLQIKIIKEIPVIKISISTKKGKIKKCEELTAFLIDKYFSKFPNN